MCGRSYQKGGRLFKDYPPEEFPEEFNAGFGKTSGRRPTARMPNDKVQNPNKCQSSNGKVGMELTRFRGHLNVLGGGVHDGEDKTAIRG